MTKKLFETPLTKDQLFDIMHTLDEETLADIHWCAEVELMDRAVTKDQSLSEEPFAYSGC
jgi:hypothetical protein